MSDRNRSVTYMLRRFLCPYNYRDTVAEAVTLCPRFRIDEVMWIPTSQVPRLGMEPLDRIETTIPALQYARDRLAEVGVAFSINVFFTLGHGEYGVDAAGLLPGMEFMVDYTGTPAKMTACPLSPVWQEWVCRTYALLASTRPARIWIDDDFRNFGHHSVTFGCYCDRHLAAFGKRIGTTPTRAELVEAVLCPGPPHPWRAPWLDFLQDTLADAARLLTRTVGQVSPETEMGWMSTNADMMVLEGRDPAVQLEALVREGDAHAHQAIRISLAGYAEGNPRRFLFEDTAIKKVVPRLLPGTLRCTEIEGCPNSAYHKSARWYGAEIAWACVLGVPHQTLNVYDYYGGAMADNPEIGRMLRARRAWFAAVAEAAAATPRHRGVRLFHPPDSSRAVHTTEGHDMRELRPLATGWDDPVRAFGVPVTFDGTQEIAAVTGQVFRCLSDDAVRDVLARGVLLDLSALRVLEERGLGHLAGATIREEIVIADRVYGYEELTDREFGGGEHVYLWWSASRGRTVGRLEPTGGARPITRLVGPDPGLVLDGMILFENELGGRVAVSARDYAGTPKDAKGLSPFYYVPRRKRLMRPVLRWLARDRVPLEVDAPGWALPHRADGDGRVLLAVMNVNLDDWNGVRMRAPVDGPVREVLRLDRRGAWGRVPDRSWQQRDGMVTVRLRGHIRALDVACVMVL